MSTGSSRSARLSKRRSSSERSGEEAEEEEEEEEEEAGDAAADADAAASAEEEEATDDMERVARKSGGWEEQACSRVAAAVALALCCSRWSCSVRVRPGCSSAARASASAADARRLEQRGMAMERRSGGRTNGSSGEPAERAAEDGRHLAKMHCSAVSGSVPSDTASPPDPRSLCLVASRPSLAIPLRSVGARSGEAWEIAPRPPPRPSPKLFLPPREHHSNKNHARHAQSNQANTLLSLAHTRPSPSPRCSCVRRRLAPRPLLCPSCSLVVRWVG